MILAKPSALASESFARRLNFRSFAFFSNSPGLITNHHQTDFAKGSVKAVPKKFIWVLEKSFMSTKLRKKKRKVQIRHASDKWHLCTFAVLPLLFCSVHVYVSSSLVARVTSAPCPNVGVRALTAPTSQVEAHDFVFPLSFIHLRSHRSQRYRMQSRLWRKQRFLPQIYEAEPVCIGATKSSCTANCIILHFYKIVFQ